MLSHNSKLSIGWIKSGYIAREANFNNVSHRIEECWHTVYVPYLQRSPSMAGAGVNASIVAEAAQEISLASESGGCRQRIEFSERGADRDLRCRHLLGYWISKFAEGLLQKQITHVGLNRRLLGIG